MSNLMCYQLNCDQPNLLFNEEVGILTKQWLAGLGHSDGQANITCSLTDTGYRIYRTPNVNYDANDSSTRTMWGGFQLNNTFSIHQSPANRSNNFQRNRIEDLCRSRFARMDSR